MMLSDAILDLVKERPGIHRDAVKGMMYLRHSTHGATTSDALRDLVAGGQLSGGPAGYHVRTA